jgi:predicted dienelactone hydrolase
MLEHYGINRNNNEIAKSDKNLQYKPRHFSLTIDYLLRENIFRQSIATDKIGVIGHSFYCYTALALAVSKPWLESDQQIIIHNDPRIKALILMAPAAA